MLLSQKQGIDDLIVENLAKNPYSSGPFLVKLVQKGRPDTTKQAVYVALKTLLENEVVAKVGTTYFLSRVWVGKLDRLFEAREKAELVRDAIFDLSEKESISYHFPNLLTCDTYWAHVFELLLDATPKETPICGWMPHEWFAIGRAEVEHNIFKQHETKGKRMLYTIGGTTPLDMLFKREWENPFVSIYTTSERPYPATYYLHVFDEFIIEVFVREDLAAQIEQFYAENKTLTLEAVAFFEKLITSQSAVRMKISRKKKKAALLRKRLSKDFFVPTDILPA